ncbi:MAG: NAD(+) diphosphatase [Xanthomonadales bacterium]|nr:NAD(+) diphosphatase [Gammaproteobacteria bacterium]MBT8054270.1 NAD(+) diphosphatase [Gammaproteobacteria bacterium]NND57537.1 NAD(+) diphosphatase [Xanthomonadales bacterium]NNK51261.1 NAD(+) diphosphatase [Xanthomonadales bacterium]
MAQPDLSIDRVTRSRRNLFASVRLDRLAEYRDDESWVEQALNSNRARFVPLWRNRSLLSVSAEGQTAVYLKPGELDQPDSIQSPTLLGTDGKRYFFAVSINDRQQEQVLASHPEAQFIDLRVASVDMDTKHAGVLAYAKALHYWQYRHAFCGICGSPNKLESAGHKLVCSDPNCGRQSFPRIDPAIIVLVTQGDACLLGRNASWPAKRFSTLAGFVEPGESLEDAVVREVFEEAQVRLKSIVYVSSQPWPFPSSAMCGFYAEAENRESSSTDEMEEIIWLSAAEMTAAILKDEIRLPPPVSIAFQLIADWYQRQCGADLGSLTRKAGGWLGRKGIK